MLTKPTSSVTTLHRPCAGVGPGYAWLARLGWLALAGWIALALLLTIRPATAAQPVSNAARSDASRNAASNQPGLPGTAQIERWLRQSVKLPDGQKLRVEVEVGHLTRGMKLAPCNRAEPFVPGHARLWGRTTIGLRCVDGARWTTFVPVRIAAWGPALVARNNLPAGHVPQPGDFAVREVDWAATRQVPLAAISALKTQELLRPLTAGQPLTTDDLRLAPAVRAGDAVGVVVAGTGFTIGVEAVALSTAADGQRIQVRTGNGKVLSGQVDGKIVRISR